MSKEDKAELRERTSREKKSGASELAKPADLSVGKKTQLLTPKKPLYGGFYLLPR